jgi:hypothetical protein
MRFVLAKVSMLTLVLVGCVPLPNFRYYAPAVSGVLTDGGRPIVNAAVDVSGAFGAKGFSTTTSDAGRFTTDPVRKLLFTAAHIGDPLYAYSVNFMVDGRQYTGYSEAGVGYAPKTIEISCDLSRPTKRDGHQFYCAPVVTEER